MRVQPAEPAAQVKGKEREESPSRPPSQRGRTRQSDCVLVSISESRGCRCRAITATEGKTKTRLSRIVVDGRHRHATRIRGLKDKPGRHGEGGSVGGKGRVGVRWAGRGRGKLKGARGGEGGESRMGDRLPVCGSSGPVFCTEDRGCRALPRR